MAPSFPPLIVESQGVNNGDETAAKPCLHNLIEYKEGVRAGFLIAVAGTDDGPQPVG